MGDTDRESEAGAVGALERAIIHAAAAARCYVSLAGAEVERRWKRMLDQFLWRAGLIGVGLIGVLLIAVGAALVLERWLHAPGLGLILVGAAMGAVLLLALAGQRRDKR